MGKYRRYARTLAGARPVWVVGHSLGGGVAFELALRRKLDALVTIGTFASIRDAAPAVARAFIPDPYDNRAAVAALDEPLFLLHGDKDDVVSPWHANELGKAANKAGNSGAAIVLMSQGHQPDAALLAGVFDALNAGPPATTGRSGARIDAAALPPRARVVPFR